VIHKSDQQCIGHCGLRYWPDSSDVEVLYALDKRYWGRGLATEGARASLRYGFADLQLDRIMAADLVDNHASRRAIEKLGMQYEKNTLFSGLEMACCAITRADYTPDDARYRFA
jgi:ribosomal-protein-alanine N-acetyltransferase